jgi:hypothetical protein
MRNSIVNLLKKYAERKAYYDDIDWYPESDNADDTYEQGTKDGETDLARTILSLANIPYIIEDE